MQKRPIRSAAGHAGLSRAQYPTPIAPTLALARRRKRGRCVSRATELRCCSCIILYYIIAAAAEATEHGQARDLILTRIYNTSTLFVLKLFFQPSCPEFFFSTYPRHNFTDVITKNKTNAQKKTLGAHHRARARSLSAYGSQSVLYINSIKWSIQYYIETNRVVFVDITERNNIVYFLSLLVDLLLKN